MSKFSKFKKFSKFVDKLIVKTKQAANEASKAVPYIQSGLALGILVNQQVNSKYSPRIDAVLKGAVKDTQVLKETLDVLVRKGE